MIRIAYVQYTIFLYDSLLNHLNHLPLPDKAEVFSQRQNPRCGGIFFQKPEIRFAAELNPIHLSVWMLLKLGIHPKLPGKIKRPAV